MHVKQQVSVSKIRKDAEDSYRNGFFCCEAVMDAIRSNFELDVPEEVIAMSSGMSVGAGRSGCMCGALNGGILALGMFFGRTVPKGPQDPKVVKCMELTNELHNWFRKVNKKNSVCCRVLTREFDMSKGRAQRAVHLLHRSVRRQGGGNHRPRDGPDQHRQRAVVY